MDGNYSFRYTITTYPSMKYILLLIPFLFPLHVFATTISGTASYYSRAGCLGCSKGMIMANGKPLDDRKLTIAMSPKLVRSQRLLNDYVTLYNPKTGKTVRAQVTDTGGFAKYNRIADLSVATRDALGCKHLCVIELTYEDN